MNTFLFQIETPARSDKISSVVSFVGCDDSGFFGLQANHVRFATCLTNGIARFRRSVDEPAEWKYLAVPGGVLLFDKNVLHLWSRAYYLGDDADSLIEQLNQEVSTEDEEVRRIRLGIESLDNALMHRLWNLDLGGGV